MNAIMHSVDSLGPPAPAPSARPQYMPVGSSECSIFKLVNRRQQQMH